MRADLVRGMVSRLLETAIPLYIPIELRDDMEAGKGFCTPEKIVLGTGGDGDEKKLALVVSTLGHEVFHLLLEHHRRGKAIVPEGDQQRWILWNLAADDAVTRIFKKILNSFRDSVINPTLLNLIRENVETHLDLSFLPDYPRDAPAEVVYRWLISRMSSISILRISGETAEVKVEGKKFSVTLLVPGGIKFSPSPASERFRMSEVLKSRGINPLEEEREWTGAGSSRSLEKELSEYLKTFSTAQGEHITFIRPDRKMFSLRYPVFIPSRIRRTVDVLVAVDTSGSITQEELNRFLSVIYASAHLLNMDLVFCDAELHGPYLLRDLPPEVVKRKLEKIKPHGGGGTRYEPVFEFFFSRNRYDLLIYFTDLFCTFPEKHPSKILWVVQENPSTYRVTPPYGKVVWF